jgi:TolA-binding protein
MILWLAAVVGLVAISNCAYFNTLYNAKKKYNDAQKTERQNVASQSGVQDVNDNVRGTRNYQMPANANQNAQTYEDVIAKCKKLIARYPKSKHVDDAMLLIGKSLFALGRYDECASALDSLTSRYPKTNLKEETEFLKAKSLATGKHYDLAAPELQKFVDAYRKSHYRPEAFYLLCTSLMQVGLSDNAVAALQRLEKDHGRSEYRYRAQTDMAAILVDKGMYKESLAVYERLSRSRIPKSVRYDVWMGMSRSQIELGRNREALATLDRMRELQIPLDREAPMQLLRGRALAGSDSTRRAISVYKQVSTRNARGPYGAEADFRLGVLYESIDSLKTAQACYQRVPSGYSQSEFADDAIKRAGDIGRMLRLQAAAGDSPEAVALRTFSMAELQLLQFNSTEKAIPAYEKIVNDYPQSEFAPKSAYALGYIYGVVLHDSLQAKQWYEVLRTRYPDSQQTQLAYTFYKGAPAPPVSEMMKFAGVNKHGAGVTPPGAIAPIDTSHVVSPPLISAPDTTHAEELPDSLTEPVPQSVDTTAAPPDTSEHGN